MIVFPNRELLPVRPPFRLDLTADALRRLATNTVDVVTPDGAYYRAFDKGGEIVAVRVTQVDDVTLCVESTGPSWPGRSGLRSICGPGRATPRVSRGSHHWSARFAV